MSGFVTVELTSADIPGFLSLLNQKGVGFHGVEQKDSLTVIVKVNTADVQILKNLAQHVGGSVKELKVSGLYWHARRFLGRPLLLCGLALLLFLIAWLPARVLFITVEGNQNLPARKIIEAAENCGITFGASRREVRSEKMKNSLLAAIPELQWAGINTFGCTAVISVKERTASQYTPQGSGVSSIVAVRDGVIESCTSSRGDMLCKPGQAVKAGEVLISGYTDCGIKIKADRADGEIYAQTIHDLTVVAPIDYSQKGEILRTERKYGLLIGKKRINFYKGSGISGTTCDKIYSEYYVTLPGGFQLPLALTVTISNVYDPSAVSVSAEDGQLVAGEYAQAYLLSQMISGKILNDVASFEQSEALCILRGRYLCSEMIGRTQNEEILDNYGEGN